MIEITVSISHVSGDSDVTLRCKSPADALKFLSDKDHEGSSVSVEVATANAEEGYALLRSLHTTR